MTLQEFFAALQNASMIVSVQEQGSGDTTTELTKIFALGYEQLLASLLARTVDKITIKSAGEAVVLLAAAV